MLRKISLFILIVVVLLLLTALGINPAAYANISKPVQSYLSSPEQLVSTRIIVSDLDFNEYNPQAAFNSKQNEYLVVWERYDGQNPGIYGQRLTALGEKIGPSPFSIAVGIKQRSQPDVAYNPESDGYLVVWTHDHDGSGGNNDISGRFIPWQGADPLIQEFKITDLPDYQTLPKVVYNSTKKEFLILWLHYASDVLKDIMGARWKAGGSGFQVKDKKILDTASNLLPNYDLEFNPARNEYLVVWTKHSTLTVSDVYMTRLKWDLQILGSKESLVTNSNDDDVEPTVASWNTSGYDGYLVAWRTVNFSGTDKIIGAYYSGNLIPYVGTVKIAESNNQEAMPHAATNFKRDQILVVWSQGPNESKKTYGVWGRYVNFGESPGQAFEIAPHTPVNGMSKGVETSAASGGKSNFLAAWEHVRPSMLNDDIYAKLIYRHANYLPLTLKK